MKHFLRLHYIFKYQNKLNSVLNKANCIYYLNLKQFSQAQSLNQWGKNKKHRNVKLQWYFDNMSDPKIEEILAPLRASVKEQVSRSYEVNCLILFFIFHRVT